MKALALAAYFTPSAGCVGTPGKEEAAAKQFPPTLRLKKPKMPIVNHATPSRASASRPQGRVRGGGGLGGGA